MEKKFTTFCIVFAVIFAVLAYIVANGEFSLLRFAGSGAFAFAALAYVLAALICSRKHMPTVT